MKAQAKASLRTDKATAASYQTAVQELYLAYFGRPADPAGLSNFESALAAAGAPSDVVGLATAYSTNPAVKSLIDSFGTSQESQNLYGNGNATAFVTAVFQNVLGRAPQSSGLSYWVGALNSGSLSQGDAALAIMAGAATNTSAQGLIDQQLIANRLAAANAFTSQVSSLGVSADYSGSLAASVARNTMNGVNSTTNISSYNGFVTDAAALSLSNITAADPTGVNASGISLLAGSIGVPYFYGPGAAATFGNPVGIAVDGSGNVFVADATLSTIQQITPTGFQALLAGQQRNLGTSDGLGTAASFSNLTNMTIDSSGNLYAIDRDGGVIRKITPAGLVSTIVLAAPAGSANLSCPSAVAFDASGNMYVADTCNYAILEVTPAGAESIFAQTISGAETCICGVVGGMAVDASGNVYATLPDTFSVIVKASPQGTVTVFAGGGNASAGFGGQGTSAQFNKPAGLAFDQAGNLYVADAGNNLIRKITPSAAVSSFAGSSRSTSGVYFNNPQGLAIDGAGNIYVADSGNRAVRVVQPSGVVSLLAGAETYFYGAADGTGAVARFNGASGIALDSSGNAYVADEYNATLRKIAPSGQVSTFAGSPWPNVQATFSMPNGIAMDASGNIYVADSQASVIRKVTPAGAVLILAGTPYVKGTTNGTGSAASFLSPVGVATDQAGNVYVADTENPQIRKITPAGVVTTVSAQYNLGFSIYPTGIAVDHGGNIYVSDVGSNSVYEIAPNGNMSLLSGSPAQAGRIDGATGSTGTFASPTGLAIDSAGNVYVADYRHGRICKITPAGVATTVVGQSLVSSTAPTLASSFAPYFVALSGSNTLYVTSSTAVFKVQIPAP